MKVPLANGNVNKSTVASSAASSEPGQQDDADLEAAMLDALTDAVLTGASWSQSSLNANKHLLCACRALLVRHAESCLLENRTCVHACTDALAVSRSPTSRFHLARLCVSSWFTNAKVSCSMMCPVYTALCWSDQ